MNLDVPDEVKQKLEDLKNTTQADSMSEVVRRALTVYDFLWNEKSNGTVTILRSHDGTERELLLL
jgi:Arc/MetJ-type ribon-helix-helix transcriptional regulator